MIAHRDHPLRLGEPRWIPGTALIVYIGLNVAFRVWLPHSGAVRVPWLIPAVEGVLLVVLLVSDPGNLARHHRLLRRISVALVFNGGAAKRSVSNDSENREKDKEAREMPPALTAVSKIEGVTLPKIDYNAPEKK